MITVLRKVSYDTHVKTLRYKQRVEYFTIVQIEFDLYDTRILINAMLTPYMKSSSTQFSCLISFELAFMFSSEKRSA